MVTGAFLFGMLAIANGFSGTVGQVAVFGAGLGVAGDFGGVFARAGGAKAPPSNGAKAVDPSKRRLPL